MSEQKQLVEWETVAVVGAEIGVAFFINCSHFCTVPTKNSAND